MHRGRFPDRMEKRDAPVRVTETEPTGLDRRQFAALLLSASAVASITTVALWRGLGATARESTPARGTLGWALGFESRTDAELVAAAGDLERIAMSAPVEPRLVALFERLLDHVVRAEGDTLDQAGACAVRGLARLGRPELAAVRRDEFTGRADRASTRDAYSSRAFRRAVGDRR